MTSAPTQPSSTNFTESVRVPGYVIGILGLVLGVTAGVMSGVAIRNLVGDEPIIEGSSAAIFYVTFAFAVLIDVFVLVNFTNLSLKSSPNGFEVRYGMFAKNFKWEQIKAADVQEYRWITYGGWGIRFSSQGRRAWSQLGVKTGVVVKVTEGGRDRSYFVSSRRPEDLELALRMGIPASETSADGDQAETNFTES